MKKKIGWMLLSLIICFAFAGCKGGKGNEEIAMGRFIEQAVEMEDLSADRIYFMLRNSKDKMVMYMTDEEGALILKEQQEDGSWKEVTPDYLSALNEYCKGEWLTAMALDAKDMPYVCMVKKADGVDENKEDDSQDMRTYVVYLEEGKAVKEELVVEDNLPYIIPEKMAVTSTGKVIFSGQYVPECAYDLKTGKLIRNYSNESGCFFVRNDKLYLLNVPESKIDIYDVSSDNTVGEVSCEDVDTTSIITAGAGESIYLITKNGIWKYEDETSMPTLIMDSNGTSLKLPSCELNSAIVIGEKVFVLQRNTQYQLLLRSYSYSATTPTLPTAELNVYTLRQDDTLMEFISNYQLAHPETRINIQVGMKEDGSVTRKDAITALNTEILSGKGPDIIGLDDLNISTYIDKGVLLDLSKIDKKDILPFVMAPYMCDEKTYALPLRFIVPTVAGEKDFLAQASSIDEFYDYQCQHQEEQVTYKEPLELVASRVAPGYQENWISENGAFEIEKIRKYLEIINQFTDPEGVNSPEEGVGYYYDYSSIVSEGIHDYTFGNNKMCQGYITNITDLLLINSANKMKKDGVLQILKQNGKTYCTPLSSVGINKNSNNKEKALEILEYMISEETQLRETATGFPVNKKSFDRWMNGEITNKDMYYSMGWGGTNSDEIIEYTWGDEDKIAAFKDQVYQIEGAKIVNEDLYDIIMNEALPYFAGNMTLDEAMDKIQAKLQLYNKE